MNKVEVLSRDAITGPSLATTRELRGPPKAVRLLLCMWGYSYVREFLESSLPTLLSPGNLPAIADKLPTEFVFLTSIDDQPFITEHPAFKRLAEICTVTIHPIDHVITDGNHSTTITLAFAEAVRDSGDAMIDTCFFFLVSDYVVADGSLANALDRMLRGASAVVVGNLQVALEDALPWLQERLAGHEQSLTLSSRELMKWALNGLHPIVLANIVNIPFSHNTDSNRLFWRVDGNTVIGRFYLAHMLCIRPEVTDFVIGASCDYSFVPEMCPSGNVETITDSDEYLVVEIQPRSHEAKFIRPGPVEVGPLAKSLSEWTTRLHRENAHRTVYFHAADLPPEIGQTVKQADAFVADVAKRLRPEPLPYRGHPYWQGAMAAFHEAGGRKLDETEVRYALALPEVSNTLTNWLVWHSKFALMGRPPWVLPWHPSWPDFRVVLNEIAPFLADPNQRMLLLSNEPTPFSVALSDNGERTLRLRCLPFLRNPPERYTPLHGRFDMCLLELDEQYLNMGGELTDRIVPLMKDGGRIILFVLNKRVFDKSGAFGRNVTFQSARFVRSSAIPIEISFVPTNFARRLGRRSLSRIRRLMNKGFWLTAPLSTVAAGFALLCSFVGNVDAWRGTRRVARRGHSSSFIMRLAVDAPRLLPLASSPRFETAQDSGEHAPKFAFPVTNETREPQYNRCLNLKASIGLTPLGLMTNQVWYDDPRRLTFLLARYKFVAKMLTGCRDVGEVGCGDAFGTRVVLQEVQDVTVYDFDPVFIDDVRARRDKKWPLRAEVHDIVSGPLPRKHDAIFSLDVIEHIARESEHAYLSNMCRSLHPGGVLMIGTPSLESQAYASPLSKAGHINCKSGGQLKALLERYFTHVFIFSMNDEVVHTGFSPMAHYLFALCSEPRWQAGVADNDTDEAGPQFAIGELPNAAGFYVSVMFPNREPQRVDGFATIAEAAGWVGEHSQDREPPDIPPPLS
jgi:SAM-dependent methyltransferase